MTTKTISGKLWEDHYGYMTLYDNHSEIDIRNAFKEFEGKKIQITIKEIEE